MSDTASEVKDQPVVTPRPWKVITDGGPEIWSADDPRHDTYIGMMSTFADSRFAVAAVNERDSDKARIAALTDALRGLVRHLSADHTCDGARRGAHAVIADARALLDAGKNTAGER